jgi:hypothetical protein
MLEKLTLAAYSSIIVLSYVIYQRQVLLDFPDPPLVLIIEEGYKLNIVKSGLIKEEHIIRN